MLEDTNENLILSNHNLQTILENGTNETSVRFITANENVDVVALRAYERNFFEKNIKKIGIFVILFTIVLLGGIGTAFGIHSKYSKNQNQTSQYFKNVTIIQTDALKISNHQIETTTVDIRNEILDVFRLKSDIADIYSLAVLPNGNQIASASKDSTIKIWNIETEQLVHNLKIHSATVRALTVLTNGLLVSGSEDARINFFNTSNGSLVNTIQTDECVFSLATLPDNLLASGLITTIKIWNVSDSSLVLTLNGHENQINSLAVLPAGFLASGSEDHSIKIWDLDIGSLIQTLYDQDIVNILLVSPDGFLISGSSDNSIKIWDVNNFKLINTLNGHEKGVFALSLLSSDYFASGSFDKTIKIWDLKKGSLVKTLRLDSYFVWTLVTLSDDRLACGADKIYIWDPAHGIIVKTLIANKENAN